MFRSALHVNVIKMLLPRLALDLLLGVITDSVKAIQQIYMDGQVTKDYYANALRAHQAYLDEIKSDQRDEAAALGDKYRYY